VKHFYFFLRDLISNRGILFELTKNDFKSRYLGSYLGLFWAFVHPTVTIVIFWFVFEVGFKSRPAENYPFVLWLIAGMIPWFFLSDSISSATTSITDKSYLVKKIVFRVGMLPIIKILSALIIHLFFVAVLFVMFGLYGYMPRLYTIQIFYYLVAAIVFTLGTSWVTSSLVVFLRDIGQIVGILLQFGFWLTPIFWSLKMLPERYRTLIKLNPAYYITEGYRDSLINDVWFWEHSTLTLYFWTVTGCIFVFGALLFKRLKPHFADVL
jgi:lipopolysaccharide transport system permease protein/teichoic acid transport system permease protein